jgi:hypothetical protein
VKSKLDLPEFATISSTIVPAGTLVMVGVLEDAIANN